MSTITKERVAEFIKKPLDNGLTRGEQMELARIALASLEAEAVAEAYQPPNVGICVALGVSVRMLKPLRAGESLYTAPPAPVSVPECFKRLLHHAYGMTMGHDWNKGTMAGHHRDKLCRAVEACRAAMIQGAEPVSNRDEFPLDYLQGHKDGLEWAAQLAEANHPQTGDWLYDDHIDLAKAIRKGPDIPELKPVAADADADDNFYSWFCREWEQNYQPNGYSLSAKKHLGAIAESAWFACRAAMLQSFGNSEQLEPVTTAYKLPEETGSSLQLRNLIRQRHAEWSQATFGNVGPVGPLKHLSKEALEAAAEPEDLSEWADLQFLLWDAQRRAGISDGEITAAMEEKLKVNMARQWPEPKDGEPRLHIKADGNSPVIPDGSDDTKRLDWLDAQNKRLNEYYGTSYGWKFDANFQRNAMMLNDSNYPVMTVRQAIDEAMAAAPQQEVK